MIIIVEDQDYWVQQIREILEPNIKKHFPRITSDLVFCKNTKEALHQTQEARNALRLLVVDLKFGTDTKAGFRFLKRLSAEQRGATVVYSAYLSHQSQRPGKKLWDDLIEEPEMQIPAEHIISKLQPSAALWSACAEVIGAHRVAS